MKDTSGTKSDIGSQENDGQIDKTQGKIVSLEKDITTLEKKISIAKGKEYLREMLNKLMKIKLRFIFL